MVRADRLVLFAALFAGAAKGAAAVSGFSFIDYFEGEWVMDKAESGKPTVQAFYRMERDSSGGGLRGQYLEGEEAKDIDVQPDAAHPERGTFARVGEGGQTTDLFAYDFKELGGGAVRTSMVAGEDGVMTTFTLTSPSSFVLLVAGQGPGTKSWAGVRKSPEAKPSAKPKSLLRRYGRLLVLAIVGLLLKQAYDATGAKGAGAAGAATPAWAPPKPTGGAAKGKSKKVD